MANGARMPFRRGFFLLAAVVLTSCARAPETVPTPADAALAAARWKHFTAIAARAENLAEPFRLNATLYYSGKEESQRVTAYLWGNGQKDAPLPLRLDILMGPGNVIASAREDSRGFFLYVPREGVVRHAGERGLAISGIPLPFTLKELAFLATGRFAAAFAPENGAPPPSATGKDGVFVYALSGEGIPGFLSVAPDGLPVAWTDDPETGWRLTLEYWPDSTRTTPRRLFIRHPVNGEATLVVRELAFPGSPFSPKQLELAVPPGTRLVSPEKTR